MRNIKSYKTLTQTVTEGNCPELSTKHHDCSIYLSSAQLLDYLLYSYSVKSLLSHEITWTFYLHLREKSHKLFASDFQCLSQSVRFRFPSCQGHVLFTQCSHCELLFDGRLMLLTDSLNKLTLFAFSLKCCHDLWPRECLSEWRVSNVLSGEKCRSHNVYVNESFSCLCY